MKMDSLPPKINKDDQVILFDGVCKLCNSWANFIIKYDKDHHLKLCSVQSEEGKNILAHFGFPTDYYETMLYIEGNSYYEKSDAFFKIVNTLGYPWRIIQVFSFIPKPIRNWMYDRVALNRYTIFGKYDYCRLPEEDHNDRYIDN